MQAATPPTQSGVTFGVPTRSGHLQVAAVAALDEAISRTLYHKVLDNKKPRAILPSSLHWM